MTLSSVPYEDQVRKSFAVVDGLIEHSSAPARLLGFRSRLLGELVYDADLVASTLNPGFELIVNAGGARAQTSGEAMVAGLRTQGATQGAAMWLDWDDLVIDDVLAGHGELLTLLSPTAAAARGISGVAPDGLAVTSVPIAFFVRFDGNLMSSEVLYMDPRQTKTTLLEAQSMPTPEQLLALVGQVPSWT